MTARYDEVRYLFCEASVPRFGKFLPSDLSRRPVSLKDSLHESARTAALSIVSYTFAAEEISL